MDFAGPLCLALLLAAMPAMSSNDTSTRDKPGSNAPRANGRCATAAPTVVKTMPAKSRPPDPPSLKPGMALAVTGDICNLNRAAAIALSHPRLPNGVFIGVRRFRQGQRGKRISLFPSAINGGSFECESFPESAHCLELERGHPRPLKYRAQPLTMALPSGETYTPDKLVLLPRGEMLLMEVKARAILQTSAVREKLDAARKVARIAGMDLQEVALDELPAEIEVARLLRFYDATIRPCVLNTLLLMLKRLLPTDASKKYGDLQTEWINGGGRERTLRHAIFLGELVWDIGTPLLPGSLIRRAH